MNLDLRTRASAIADDAEDLFEPDRAELIHERCGDDNALREAVDGEMKRRTALDHARVVIDGEVLVRPAPGPAPRSSGGEEATVIDEVRASTPGGELFTTRYEIRGIRDGGTFGEVLEAFDRALQRTVAIKVERRSGASDHRRRRFLREARILARLQHPNVLPIHDVGRTSDDRLYFAMPLLSDRTLEATISTDSTDELVSAVIAVLDAAHHAHTAGVIHRDIKPANVVRGLAGGTYLIDWGISFVDPDVEKLSPLTDWAPADDSDDDGSWSTTRASRVPGTLYYVAPESADASYGDIGPWSDVYSVGAMLFRFLTGKAPHDTGADGSESWGEALQRSLRSPLPSVARLAPEVDRNLAAIVDRSLAQQAADRYRSAKLMADDLRAWQAGRAVSARRPGLPERLAMWVRRAPRAAAASLAGLILAVGLAILISVVLSSANDRLREEERISAGRAEFVERALIAANPMRAGSLGTTLGDLLADLRASLPELDDDPELEAEMSRLLGRIYRANGEVSLGEPLIHDAYEWAMEHYDEDDPRRAAFLVDEGAIMGASGDLDGARELYEEALRLRVAYDPDDRLRIVELRALLATLDGGRETIERSLAESEAEFGRDHPLTLDLLRDLGIRILQLKGDPAEAEALLREAVDRQTAMGVLSRSRIATSERALADALGQQGKHAEAEEIRQRLVDWAREAYGADSQIYGAMLTSLDATLVARGRLEESVELGYELIALAENRRLPVEEITARSNLGLRLMRLRRYGEMAAVLRPGIELCTTAFTSAHRTHMNFLLNVSAAEGYAGRVDVALAHARAAIAISKQIQPFNPQWQVAARSHLGTLLTRIGQSESALAELESIRADLAAWGAPPMASLDLLRRLEEHARRAGDEVRATAIREEVRALGLSSERLQDYRESLDRALADKIPAATSQEEAEPDE